MMQCKRCNKQNKSHDETQSIWKSSGVSVLGRYISYGWPRQLPLFHAIRLRVKGGLPSIVPQELLLSLKPSPPGLDHGIASWHTSGG